MYVKQISVFIENRMGRMQQVCECLTENDINISSVILADTNEYGLLRMIVSDTEKAKEVLVAAGFSAIITDVIAVKFPHTAGTLKTLLEFFAAEDLNVEYMYGLSQTDVDAVIIFKTSVNEKAVNAIKNKGGQYGIKLIDETMI